MISRNEKTVNVDGLLGYLNQILFVAVKGMVLKLSKCEICGVVTAGPG